MSYEPYHEHVHTRPQPIFGLAGACAPACRQGRDRVQSGLNMRGPAGPGGEKLIEEPILPLELKYTSRISNLAK